MHVLFRTLACCAALLLGACAAVPQTGTSANAPVSPVAAHFEALKKNPAQLTAFLRVMPKGGDLHSHLSGTTYAESFIAWGIADGRCLIVASQTITDCDPARDDPTLADAVAHTDAYNALIDALSVRNYARRPVSGHDQFFGTFARFDAAEEGREGDMLAEATARAADQNILYLELMNSNGMVAASTLAKTVPWDEDPDRYLANLRAAGLDAIAREASSEFAAMTARSRVLLGCDTRDADPGCAVEVRYIAQVIRIFPKEQVFAQNALGFLLASQDPQVVGLNLVAPEDDRVSLANYSAHMRFIGAMRPHFPEVGITLHAGELTLGLVPPEALRFHIAEAVRVAGATRIGHGVDILYEDNPAELLAEMALNRVMVEINLTSNAVILEVEGADHPFQTYRKFGVPLALSTDDEGVSRIDLTHEYRRAVETYDLSYGEIKELSRNSLTYAFIDGASLWPETGYSAPVAACRNDPLGAAKPSRDCATFLQASAKATLQWALEAAFVRFETFPALAGR